VRNPLFCSRREFIGAISTLAAGNVFGAEGEASEPVIDIHQHTNYSGRTDEQLIAHQRRMGVTTTVLLPAGKWYGLDAQCGGNDTVLNLASRFPKQYYFFANEIPYLDTSKAEITNYLKRGAIGIGEQKFRVLSNSAHLHKIIEVAKEFKVPVLMHFQATDYNLEIEQFHKTLEKFPDVNFIGHAQTFWGNIDKEHKQEVMYPTGKVTAGGITDRLLSDYPNMFGDMSAGSGLNAIIRDEEHYRGFMERHRDKLMFGSDCNDAIGAGPGCQGAQILAGIRRVAPSKEIERKLVFENAKRVLRI
jgi:predicted TIM-barrel fold metal-dependent hydrolase